jgi:3-dehydroquinate dehydratase type I
MNLVLTGPMGVGKSAVGIRAAKVLGQDFVDTDKIVEERTGHSINELFAKKGERHFRVLENKVIEKISRTDNTVIATGGGVVLDPKNMKMLRSNGVIITLQAPLSILLKRLKNVTDRPLLGTERDKKRLKRYLDGRARFYSNTDHRIDTGKMKIEDVVARVCDIARMPRVRICGCISGKKAKADIRTAIENGVSMIELRLDLIPHPDIRSLIKMSSVPVIATDRRNKKRLMEAINAGCDLVDIETGSPEKDRAIRLAKKMGCKVIASFHDLDAVPWAFPDKGAADLLKIAVMINSKKDIQRIVAIYGHRDDVILVGMGKLGVNLRVIAPLLGSFLTYCYIGRKTAPGQLDLLTMNKIYKELGLR